jgi:hypothetical protein
MDPYVDIEKAAGNRVLAVLHGISIAARIKSRLKGRHLSQ